MTFDLKRYNVFIAGERMGGVCAKSPEDAVKAWIASTEGRPISDIAESNHCRVCDIWAEEIGEKVYS